VRETVTCPLQDWPPEWSRTIGQIRFAGVSGRCHEGHSRCVRQLKREQAEHRNGLSLPRNRKANRLRAKRPKQEPPAPLTVACPWPWKDAHPDKAAAQRHLTWLKHNGDENYKTAEVYDCPAADHWHIGHPRVPAERGRKQRYRPDEEEAA